MKKLILFTLGFFILIASGCRNECPPPERCEMDYAINKENKQPYMKGELVFTLPDKNPNTLFTDSLLQKEVGSLVVEVLIDLGFNNIVPNVERCLCDAKIFNISNLPVGAETGIAQAGNDKEEVRNEGGQFSLNYLVGNPSNDNPEQVTSEYFKNKVKRPEREGNSDERFPVVAVLDSGIDFTHFANTSGIYQKRSNESVCDIQDDTYGYNFISDKGSTDPLPNNNIEDYNGHGTLVSKTYEHRMDQLMGVDFGDQRMLTVKVLNDCGIGTIYSTTCGLAYAKRKGAKVANCSWGITFNDIQMQRVVREVTETMMVVCSAGNEGKLLVGNGDVGDVHFPSGYGHNFNIVSYNGSITTSVENNSKVFEVMGSQETTNHAYTSITSANYSNKRKPNFIESGNNATYVIGEMCTGVYGTSFAAPSISAGAVHLEKTGSIPFGSTSFKSSLKSSSTQVLGGGYSCYSLNNQ